ncbi:MAG: DUF6541 family protein [Pseudonocardiaceae bacterium]
MQDTEVLLVALFVTYLPGLGLMAALGVRRPVLLLGLAPAASVGVAAATGVLTALVGYPYGPAALGAVTALLVMIGATLAVLSRRRAGPPRPARRRGTTAQVVGALMVLGGAGVGVGTWLGGLQGFSTIPQEHDMIIHAVQAAYIERTGNAAPWELFPVDVLTGAPVAFYPSGIHLLMAVSAVLTGGTVEAINAVTVVVLAVVLSGSAAALTAVAARHLRLSTSTAALAGGVAALVAAGLYRPTFHLMHDGGILANAAALAMAPGVVAGVLLLPRLRWPSAVAVGVACAGVLWVHPSAAVSVGVTVLAWWAGQALARQGRRQLRGLTVPLLVAGASAGLLIAAALPTLLATAGRTSGFPPDSGPTSLRDALGSTFGLTYGGHLDPEQSRAQATAVVLTVVGVVAVLALRRGYGPVAAWAAWSLITIGAFRSPAVGLESMITGVFYNALLRTWAHVSLLVPLLAALGIVLTANLLAVLVRRRTPLRARPVAAVLVLAAWVGYLVGQTPEYARTNTTSVASRYGEPDFVRVDADDQRAIDWLAARVQPGQRVLNSPNDGSTYLYVERGVPVVNAFTLGTPAVPYSYRLLESFRSYPTDAAIRSTLRALDVAWVYVDSEAPRIGSRGSPGGWAGTSGFALAPGLTDLEGLPGLAPVFRSGSVTVYSLSL